MNIEQQISHNLSIPVNASVLIIGSFWKSLFADNFFQSQSNIKFLPSFITLSQLQHIGVYDYAFISDTLEFLGKIEGEQFLCKVRNYHASRFLLAIVENLNNSTYKSVWQPNELFAYGLTFLASEVHSENKLYIYRYDIFDYKVTPDWLNSRFWANPELFDK